MVDRGFNSIFILIAVLCIYTQLDVVLLLNEEEIYDDSNGADLAVHMDYNPDGDGDGNILSVYICYDVGANSAKDFFTNQFKNNLLERCVSCPGVKFIFSPCSTSQFNKKGSLQCGNDKKKCDLDRIHSCVMSDERNNAIAKGNFVACTFTGKSLDECFKKLQEPRADIDKCTKGDGGDFNCVFYHGIFVNVESINKKGKAEEFINKFQSAFCDVLKKSSMQCKSACDST